MQKVREIEARDGEDFQVFYGGGFVPMAAAQSGIVRLKAPRDERGEASGFCTTEEEVRRVIRYAGFRPEQRDTLYRQYFLN